MIHICTDARPRRLSLFRASTPATDPLRPAPMTLPRLFHPRMRDQKNGGSTFIIVDVRDGFLPVHAAARTLAVPPSAALGPKAMGEDAGSRATRLPRPLGIGRG